MPFADLKRRVVQQVSTDESEALSIDDFILAEPLTETQLKNHLTEENFRRAEEYRRLCPEAIVADLGQNPGVRARCGTVFFPTLTTTCTKFMHLPTKHIYSSVLSATCICLCIACSKGQGITLGGGAWWGGVGHHMSEYYGCMIVRSRPRVRVCAQVAGSWQLCMGCQPRASWPTH